MGSWFGTCGVSQLPIFESDEIVLFVISKNKSPELNGMVEPNTMFTPVAPPLFGIYADFGGVKLNEFNDRVDKVVKLDEKINGRKEIYNMLINKRMYESIINEYGEKVNWDTEDESLRGYLTREAINYVKGRRAEEDGGKINPKLDYNRFKRILEDLNMTQFYINYEIYDDNLEDDELINSLVSLIIFHIALESSRKMWAPQVGLGSQSVDYEMNEIIADVTRVEGKRRSEW